MLRGGNSFFPRVGFQTASTSFIAFSPRFVDRASPCLGSIYQVTLTVLNDNMSLGGHLWQDHPSRNPDEYRYITQTGLSTYPNNNALVTADSNSRQWFIFDSDRTSVGASSEFVTLENQMPNLLRLGTYVSWFDGPSDAFGRYRARFTFHPLPTRREADREWAGIAAGNIDAAVAWIRDYAIRWKHGVVITPHWECNGDWYAGSYRDAYGMNYAGVQDDVRKGMARIARILKSRQGSWPPSGWNDIVKVEWNTAIVGSGNQPWRGRLEEYYAGDTFNFPDPGDEFIHHPNKTLFDQIGIQGYAPSGSLTYSGISAEVSLQFWTYPNYYEGGTGTVDATTYGWAAMFARGEDPLIQRYNRIGSKPLFVGEMGCFTNATVCAGVTQWAYGDGHRRWVSCFFDWYRLNDTVVGFSWFASPPNGQHDIFREAELSILLSTYRDRIAETYQSKMRGPQWPVLVTTHPVTVSAGSLANGASFSSTYNVAAVSDGNTVVLTHPFDVRRVWIGASVVANGQIKIEITNVCVGTTTATISCGVRVYK